jgi:ribose/xylose/arabinose/galactoside ABC-type transport system permease subunit
LTMTELTETPAAGKRSRSSIASAALLGRFAPVIFLVALMVVFAVLEPRFLSSLNLFNVMRQISITGLIAVGMTFVILTAGIDLSVGSVVALAGLAAAVVAKGGAQNRFSIDAGDVAAAGYGWFAAMLAATLVGTVCGWIQGIGITRLKVPPFVVTLGGLSAFRGAALLIAGGGPLSGFQESYVWWGQGRIGPVPVPVILFLCVAVIAHVVLRFTRYGRQVYAVGGNQEAARLSGVDVKRVLLSVYVIVGMVAGFAGFVLSARLNSSEAVAGIGYELTVIASVVIGGTSLFGGTGTIFGTVIGSILIGVLINGLVLMNISSYIQQIIIGVITVLAVAFDQFAKQRKRA